jgi:hypothetical protein
MRKGLIVSALLAYVAWQIWLTVAAPAKISPDLAKAEAEKVNVLVTLPFPPERFHVLVFQRYGRVSGTIDNSIEVRGIARGSLTSVARPYWVKKVEPLGGGQP